VVATPFRPGTSLLLARVIDVMRKADRVGAAGAFSGKMGPVFLFENATRKNVTVSGLPIAHLDDGKALDRH